MSIATQKLNADRIYKVIQIKEAERPTVHMPTVATLDPAVKICLERAELVTESYRRTERQPWILRRARALDHLLRNMTIYIQDGEQIVGNYAGAPDGLPTYPEFSYRWLEESLDDEFRDTLDDEGRRRLKEINRYWATQSVESAFLEAVREDLREYIGWTGAVGGPWLWPMGMMMPDYARVFRLGLDGLIGEVRTHRAKLSGRDPEYREKVDFYEAAEISAKAVIAFARRYAELAGSKAEAAEGKTREDLETVARICSRVPDKPPETLHEALQAFYFHHLVTTQISWCSVGLGQRFDQLFWSYYKKEKETGTITYERAVELLEFLWIKLDDLGQINPSISSMIQVGGTKFQNVTIGGVDENGNDATNELSFAIIDATMNIRTLQPSLCLRYHDRIDPKLVDKAIDCIATGIGMPAIFNDAPAMKWHLNTSLEHLYPESGKHFGFKRLGPLQKMRGSRTLRSARSTFFRCLPKRVRETIEEAFLDWPHKACAGGGKIGNASRKALKWLGVFDADRTLALARGWASTACVGGGFTGVVFQGTLTTIITASILNFLKCIEYVMYRGVEPSNGKQLGLRTPDPRTFGTYEEFQDAFLRQLRFQVEQVARVYAVCEKLYQERTPRPFASLLMTTPVLRGRDATHGGDGGYSEVFTMAPVNAADSLAVVKKLVFDEKSVSMDELISACAADFEGHADVRRRCLRVPKFGNDDDYVDHLLEDMYRKASGVIRSVEDHFGKPFSPEATLAGGYFAGGLSTGATPDGRRRGDTVSDGQLSPMHGRDVNGPTAVLKSCSKVDPSRTWNQLLNQKFTPSLLKGKNKKIFADYLKTWAQFGNWHIQFNCVDSGVLKDAQLHPERHANLIVRVAGYSAHFIDLTPGLQRDIINRTEQSLHC